ncbi:MAG: HAD family hydrolase [Nocardioidaceae bacterium]
MNKLRRVVTFDLFSALIDSRSGGSVAFDALARAHDWPVSGLQLYDAWDPRNKAAQRDCTAWEPWRGPAGRAVAAAYADLGLDGEADEAVEALVRSMPEWPLWPDVPAGLPALREEWRVGLLSSVDDDLFASTAAAPLVDHDLALTSERLGVYKPHAAIYRRAVDEVGPLVHVATSARDVRGALEAEIPTVWLQRPGHQLDADGPRPTYEVTSTVELPVVLAAALRGSPT